MALGRPADVLASDEWYHGHPGTISMHDILIKNGLVVDGTGMLAFEGDVAIRDGRIAERGRVSGAAGIVIDAQGLVVAPGFIDMHTHYDCQLLWDPLATSSCWHGVTTVVTGNCGFTIAPGRPSYAEYLMRLMARVEAMEIDVLRAGIQWGLGELRLLCGAAGTGPGLKRSPSRRSLGVALPCHGAGVLRAAFEARGARPHEIAPARGHGLWSGRFLHGPVQESCGWLRRAGS